MRASRSRCINSPKTFPTLRLYAELGRVRAVEAGLRDLQGRIHGGEAIGGRPSA